jgi:hypothetical protein
MIDRRSYVKRFREVTDLFKASLGDYCISRYKQYAASQNLAYLDLIKADITKYAKSEAVWGTDEATQKLDDIRLWLNLLNHNWELFMKPADETDIKIGSYCAAYLYKRLNNLHHREQQISDREAYDLIDAIASLMEVMGPSEFARTANDHIDELWHSHMQWQKTEALIQPVPSQENIPPSRNGASPHEYTLPYLDGDPEGDENTARLPLSGHGYLIEITYADQRKEQLCIEESPFIIGRNKRNHLVIKDRYMSRYHLMLTCVREQEIFAQDLDSINGTFLEGERLEAYARVAWQTGQSIKVGETHLTLRGED